MKSLGLEWASHKRRLRGTTRFGAGLLVTIMSYLLYRMVQVVSQHVASGHDVPDKYTLFADILLTLVILGLEIMFVMDLIATLRIHKASGARSGKPSL